MAAIAGTGCSTEELAEVLADRRRVLAAARAVGMADFLLSRDYARTDAAGNRRRLVRLGEVIDQLRAALDLPDPAPDLARAYPPRPANGTDGVKGGGI